MEWVQADAQPNGASTQTTIQTTKNYRLRDPISWIAQILFYSKWTMNKI